MFLICSYSSATYPNAARLLAAIPSSALLWWRLLHKTVQSSISFHNLAESLISTVVIGEAMDQALHMPLVERRKRWFNMMGELCRSDIVRWRERFVTVLQSAA